MARKPSCSETAVKLRQSTRFILCRTAQGYWIAGAKGGRVTAAFPVPQETARFALQHLLQSSFAKSGMRGARASPARRS